MIFRQIASPNPVPRCLPVVKNGSKIRGRALEWIPFPLSSTFRRKPGYPFPGFLFNRQTETSFHRHRFHGILDHIQHDLLQLIPISLDGVRIG